MLLTKLCPIGARTEDQSSPSSQPVSQSVYKGCFWANDEQISFNLFGRIGNRAWDTGVTRSHNHVGVPPQNVSSTK